MDKIFDIQLPQLPHSSTYEQAGKAQEALVMAALGTMAKATWTKLAMDRLSTRRRDMNDYVRSIQDPEILPGMATISLVGQRAHDMEFGKAQYDLRDSLLGPNVPVKKRGDSGRGKYRSKQGQFYRPIPFRHSGPGSLGTTGAPMGSAHAGAMGGAAAQELGRFIFRQAKELSASVEKPNRRVQWGERLIAGLAPKLKTHHHSDIYAGMVKINKTYGKATQSQYKTFRTISTSKRVGWIVPATQGYNLLTALRAHMKTYAPAYVSQIINAPSGGGSPPSLPVGGP